MSVGILGIGTYLPPEIRTNDWWPSATVNSWKKPSKPHDLSALAEGPRVIAEALEKNGADPFQGALERRIMATSMRSSEMETLAAEDALSRAGIDRSKIGLLVVHSAIPDFIHQPNAARVHATLGLAPSCFSMSVEGMCHAFLQQLTIASELIRGGTFSHALVIVSSALSRVMNPAENFSPWFGDGAAAIVIGRVPDGLGILAHSHDTDGSVYGSLVSGVHGAEWYENGRIFSYLADRKAMAETMFAIAGNSKRLLDNCYTTAHVSADEVDFLACHQPNSWLGQTLKGHLQLANARTLNTFKWTASMSAVNLPFILATAQNEGMLREGNLVACFAGGAGATCSGLVMRWGV